MLLLPIFIFIPLAMWYYPSKHFLVFKQDVLKTSSRQVLKTSSTRLQCKNFCLPRRLEDVLKMSWRRLEDISQDVLKTFWKTKNCYAEDVLKMSWRHVVKTSWRHVLKTSSRRLGDKKMGISASHKSKWCVSTKSIFHKFISDESKANPKSLKLDSDLPKKFLFISFNESTLKIIKNIFYFILKALFVLKIFRFLSWHFGHIEETA